MRGLQKGKRHHSWQESCADTPIGAVPRTLAHGIEDDHEAEIKADACQPQFDTIVAYQP